MPPQNPAPIKPATPAPAVADISAIPTPEGLGIKIDDVNKSLWAYVKQRKLGELLLLVPLVAIWEAGLVFIFIKYLNSSSDSSNSGRGYGDLMAAPFAVFAAWIYRIKKQFEDVFLQEFALSNGYTFSKTGRVDETYGSIFRIEGRQAVSDVVSGTYAGNDLRLFIYELTTGSGNQKQTYRDTVIEIDLHGQLPSLLMVNKKSHAELNLSKVFGTDNTFRLEGDFNNYFTLYGEASNQIEALEVFSPDTMALMEDESKHYTVEFSGNRIYIYAKGFIGTTQDITQAFALAKKLIDKIGPLASRLAHDSAIVPTPVNLQKSRKATMQDNKLVIAIVVIIFAFTAIVTAVSVAHQPKTYNINSGINMPNSSIPAIDKSPNCGVKANPGQPIYTQQFIAAIIADNQRLQAVSTAIINANNTATNAIVDQMLASDQQYISDLQAISFPVNVQPDVTQVISDIQNYDKLIQQEETGQVQPAFLTGAHYARSKDSNKLHEDLGLPISTCSFYEP